MNKTTKFLLTGVTTLGILGIGTAGAMAMTSSLGVKDQAGTVQAITPVKTGSSSSAPSSSPTPVPSGATTVAPAAPVYLDDKGGLRSGASDDSTTRTGTGHEVGDDNGVDPSGHDATDDKSGGTSGDKSSGTSGDSGTSGSDGSKSGGGTSGGNDGGSGHN